MNRQQFIQGLRRALAGKVEPEVINDTVCYYEDYIDTQLRQGEQEGQVLERLGEPSLLARSIVSARESGGNTTGERGIVGEGEDEKRRERFSRTRLGDWGVRQIMRMPAWLTVCLAGLIVLFLIAVTLSMISFLAPALLLFAIASLVIHLMRRT